MNDTDFETVLIAKLAESRGTTQDEVRNELERLGAIDSLEGLELLMDAERGFEISISDQEISSDVCRSIPKMVALVRLKLALAGAIEGEAE